MTVLAITGHRPQRIPDSTRVRAEIGSTLAELSPSLLIQGMANGVDMWSAAEAWKLSIPYVAVRPWAGHRAGTREAYDWVMKNARDIVVTNDSVGYPGPYAYIVRNNWMIDNSDLLLAVWDGQKNGGTWAAVKYAQSKAMDIVRIEP